MESSKLIKARSGAGCVNLTLDVHLDGDANRTAIAEAHELNVQLPD